MQWPPLVDGVAAARDRQVPPDGGHPRAVGDVVGAAVCRRGPDAVVGAEVAGEVGAVHPLAEVAAPQARRPKSLAARTGSRAAGGRRQERDQQRRDRRREPQRGSPHGLMIGVSLRCCGDAVWGYFALFRDDDVSSMLF